MSILDQLSSSLGTHNEQANLAVVARCLAKPVLLKEIAGGLSQGDAALAGDCAEVLTHVAANRPQLVTPYAQQLFPLLDHPSTRVRWEAMHAVANIAKEIPEELHRLIPALRQKIAHDPSVIVRDHAIQAIGHFASTGAQEAQAAFPILMEALAAWDGKHAALALNGLASIAVFLPSKAGRLESVAQEYESSRRGVVRKAALALKKKVTESAKRNRAPSLRGVRP